MMEERTKKMKKDRKTESEEDKYFAVCFKKSIFEKKGGKIIGEGRVDILPFDEGNNYSNDSYIIFKVKVDETVAFIKEFAEKVEKVSEENLSIKHYDDEIKVVQEKLKILEERRGYLTLSSKVGKWYDGDG